MKKQEKEIEQRYEAARNEFEEAKSELNKIRNERKLENLNKKYANKYFKAKNYDCYFFVKRICNELDLICDCVTIDENNINVYFDYKQYLRNFIAVKSNKLEFTNALNVAMDRLFNLKKLMI